MSEEPGSVAESTRAFHRPIRPDESTGTAVVRAVSQYAGSDLDSLPVIYDCVDPEVLDGFCDSLSRGCSVTFRYAGFRVSVVDGETVELRPAERDGR